MQPRYLVGRRLASPHGERAGYPHRGHFPSRRNVYILSVPLIFIARAILAQGESSQEIQRQRQEIVTAILTSNRTESVEKQRWACISGREPSRVKEARAGGMDFTPDASDSCLAALQRAAKDGKLGDAYKKLLVQTGGDAEFAEKLPRAIGASVLSGDGKVALGNGKAMTATAPIAFDAGFTVAYIDGAAKKQGMDSQKLRALAEACLSNDKDAGTCFSIGYVFGGQAFNAR